MARKRISATDNHHREKQGRARRLVEELQVKLWGPDRTAATTAVLVLGLGLGSF